MRAVVQRVLEASVAVDGDTIARIGPGLAVLVGVATGDGEADARALADKVAGLRIFEDDSGKMNRSVLDTGGAVLAISQFTLLGDARSGKRPSFTAAMDPGGARPLFDAHCAALRAHGVRVETGRFRAHMVVRLANDGPVTLLLDTARVF